MTTSADPGRLSEEAPDIVTIGETMVAFVASREGRLRHATSFERMTGGAEGTFAVAATRMGLRVAWIGKLGADEFGDVVLASLQAEGVDTSRVTRDAARPTGLMFKERSADPAVVYYRSGDAAASLTPEDVDWPFLRSARHVHMTGISLALSETCQVATAAALETARAHGLRTSFDVNMRLRLQPREWWEPAIRDVLPHVDVLFLTADEGRLLTGVAEAVDIADRLAGQGVRVIVVKQGQGGSLVRCAGEVIEQRAVPVGTVVNTHGAGDAYAGGFVGGMLLGMPLARCARAGALLGASATRASDPVHGLLTRDELLVRLDDQDAPSR